MGGTVRQPGEGETHRVGSGEIVVKATADETAGGLYLSEMTVAPRTPGPPLHRHSRICDMFYVLEGSITVRIEGGTHALGPGGFAAAPPGVAHTFSNPNDAPARILNLSAPAGFERYVRELAAAFAGGGAPSAEQMAELFARNDVEVVPEP